MEYKKFNLEPPLPPPPPPGWTLVFKLRNVIAFESFALKRNRRHWKANKLAKLLANLLKTVTWFMKRNIFFLFRFLVEGNEGKIVYPFLSENEGKDVKRNESTVKQNGITGFFLFTSQQRNILLS